MDGWQWLEQQERPRFQRMQVNLFAAVFGLMKLVPARYILERALADGALVPGGHVVETTSGTFGLALSLLASTGGLRLTLVTADSLVDSTFLQRLRFLGTDVVIVEDAQRSGDQQGRLNRLKNILHTGSGAFWPRQYDNPQNREAYAPVAEQAVKICARIDILVGCVGTGGSLFGFAESLCAVKNIKVVAVDTHRSVLFGQPAGSRQLRGLGNSLYQRPSQMTLMRPGPHSD